MAFQFVLFIIRGIKLYLEYSYLPHVTNLVSFIHFMSSRCLLVLSCTREAKQSFTSSLEKYSGSLKTSYSLSRISFRHFLMDIPLRLMRLAGPCELKMHYYFFHLCINLFVVLGEQNMMNFQIFRFNFSLVVVIWG